MTVIAQKVERQPAAWPSIVPNGTPRTLAAVSPVNIMAMAPAFLVGATMLGGDHRADAEERAVARAAMMRPTIIRRSRARGRRPGCRR